MRKYQVFLSSTYEDLKDERNEVIKCLLRHNCFPVGMEYFPASNLEQWEYIKKLIDQCDYYLVVVAGRYGSEDETGISYTQKEYEYALKSGTPVAAILYHDIQELRLKDLDSEASKTHKLLEFRKLVQKKLCSYYQNKHELSAQASLAIQHLISEFPKGGWIKSTNGDDNNQENSFQSIPQTLQPKYIHKMCNGVGGSIDQALTRHEVLKFIDNISKQKDKELSIRNQLFIAASYATGAKLRELNNLKIKDVMNEDGTLKRYCKTRLMATSPYRILFLNNYIFSTYLENYFRLKINGIETSNENYRGLEPTEPLFLSKKGGGFPKKLKKVKGNYYSSTNTLGQLLSQLHKNYSGIDQVIKESGRKTTYSILKKRNVAEDIIACILGFVPSEELLSNEYLMRKCLEATYSLYD